MHHTAFISCILFFQILDSLLPGNISSVTRILDVGSYDVNGNNKDCIKFSGFGKKRKFEYIGLDRYSGPNVDVVQNDSNWPFTSDEFDIILSTSCLEHDNMFWLTFLQMSRSLKAGGLIWINVPGGSESNRIHRYPVDNYRFFPDAAYALAKWVQMDPNSSQNLSVVHSSMMGYNSFDLLYEEKPIYGDTVMIFRKHATSCSNISNIFIRAWDSDGEHEYHQVDGFIQSRFVDEFSFYKLDWMTMVSNFALINANTFHRTPRSITVFNEGEMIPSTSRNIFPGIAMYNNTSVFVFHHDDRILAVDGQGDARSITGATGSHLNEDIEIMRRIKAYMERSYHERQSMALFEQKYILAPLLSPADKNLFLGKFQFAPPNGELSDISLSLDAVLAENGNGIEVNSVVLSFVEDAIAAMPSIVDGVAFAENVRASIQEALIT